MLKYYAIFHPAVEGGYWVSFPDAEAVNTQGDTLDEALDMATDALSAILVHGRKGREYREPSSYDIVAAEAGPGDLVFPVVPNEKIMDEYRPKKRVNVMLPVDRLDTIAEIIKESDGLDRSKFITKAIDYYVDNLGRDAR
jgi:predicted RNase H-like HicB family nuclease